MDSIEAEGKELCWTRDSRRRWLRGRTHGQWKERKTLQEAFQDYKSLR